jgi:hypothetical protein
MVDDAANAPARELDVLVVVLRENSIEDVGEIVECVIAEFVHADDANGGANRVRCASEFRKLSQKEIIFRHVFLEACVAHPDHFEIERLVVRLVYFDQVGRMAEDRKLPQIHPVSVMTFSGANDRNKTCDMTG